MTSKKRGTPRHKDRQRGPTVSPKPPAPHPTQAPHEATDSHRFLRDMAIAVAGAVAGALVAGIITYTVTPKNQSAANAAQIKAAQAQEASTLRQYAQEVSYGLGPAPGRNNGSPQLIIENRSNGWLRDVTLILPIPTSGNGIDTSVNPVDGMVGSVRINSDENGNSVTFQLANIPPCEMAITKILAAIPGIEPGDLADSRLIFTDQKGNGWILHGNGQLVKGIDFLTQQEMGAFNPLPGGLIPNGPGTSGWAWSGTGNLEPVVGGCPG